MDRAKPKVLNIKTVIICVLGLLLLLVLSGCSRPGPADKADIPGTYLGKYKYHNGIEELILRPDGAYEETFTFDVAPFDEVGFLAGAQYHNSGRWEYVSDSGESHVLLEDAMIAPSSEPPIRGKWDLKARARDANPAEVVLEWGDPDGIVILIKRN